HSAATALSDAALDDLLDARLTSERISCEVTTISDVIREHAIERIDLLKIDVEKSEEDVLAGIRAADWPKIRQLVVEVYDSAGRLDRLAALLRRQGYQLHIEQDMLL